MDPISAGGAANAGGLTVTVIGVSTVFLALVSLNLFVRLLQRSGEVSSAAGPATADSGAEPAAAANAQPDANSESSTETSEEPGPELERIALAAYGLHRRHRIDSGSAGQPTEWTNAGRARQSNTFER